MASPRSAVVVLCALCVASSALKLPAQERTRQLHERLAGELSTRAPAATPPPPPAAPDRSQTVPPGRFGSAAKPEPEPEPKPEPELPAEPELKQEPKQEQELEPEQEPEAEPDEEQSVPESDDGELAVPSPDTPIQANRQVDSMTQEVDEPKVISSEQDDSNVKTTTEAVPVTREPVPSSAYAVFDHRGHICILATLMMDIEVIYFTEYAERRKVSISLPEDADVTGACARDGDRPQIDFSWNDGNYKFSILFSENEFGNTWYVSDMKFEYSMDSGDFPEARPMGMQRLWMDTQKQHTLHLFGTPVDKAYYCTSEQDLDLYNGDGARSATVILWNVHLQPYVRSGQFGASVNCPGGKVGRRRINETVPMAVGSTLATVTLLTIAGYAVWRHFKVKKFNYDTME